MISIKPHIDVVLSLACSYFIAINQGDIMCTTCGCGHPEQVRIGEVGHSHHDHDGTKVRSKIQTFLISNFMRRNLLPMQLERKNAC